MSFKWSLSQAGFLKDSSGVHYGWQLPFAVFGGSLALKPMRSGKPIGSWIMNDSKCKFVNRDSWWCVHPRAHCVHCVVPEFNLCRLRLLIFSCTPPWMPRTWAARGSWLAAIWPLTNRGSRQILYNCSCWVRIGFNASRSISRRFSNENQAETKCAALADMSQTWPSSLTHNPQSEYVRTLHWELLTFATSMSLQSSILYTSTMVFAVWFLVEGAGPACASEMVGRRSKIMWWLFYVSSCCSICDLKS